MSSGGRLLVVLLLLCLEGVRAQTAGCVLNAGIYTLCHCVCLPACLPVSVWLSLSHIHAFSLSLSAFSLQKFLLKAPLPSSIVGALHTNPAEDYTILLQGSRPIA